MGGADGLYGMPEWLGGDFVFCGVNWAGMAK